MDQTIYKRSREEGALEETWLFLANGERLFLPRMQTTSIDGNQNQYGDISIFNETQQVDEFLQENYKCLVEQNSKLHSSRSSPYTGHTYPRGRESIEQAQGDVSIIDEGSTNFLNVCEGEMAHATPCQADSIGSTDATTCHVLAIRSTKSLKEAFSNHVNMKGVSVGEENDDVSEKDDHSSLATVAHINKSTCSDSLKQIIQHHLKFHGVLSHDARPRNHDFDEDSKCDQGSTELVEPTRKRPKLSLDDTDHEPRDLLKLAHFEIHLAGGFIDERGISQDMSSFILSALCSLSEKYKEVAHMSLLTCAISCMNTAVEASHMNHDEGSKKERNNGISILPTDSIFKPIARGLCMYTRSGKVHMLNSVPDFLEGPEPELRQARLWADTYSDELTLVHDSCQIHSTLEVDESIHSERNEVLHRSRITIEPFEYHFSSKFRRYLALKTDKDLLRKTSTSPHCEGSDFCEKIRRTFRFMRDTPCKKVFGPTLSQSVEHDR